MGVAPTTVLLRLVFILLLFQPAELLSINPTALVLKVFARSFRLFVQAKGLTDLYGFNVAKQRSCLLLAHKAFLGRHQTRMAKQALAIHQGKTVEIRLYFLKGGQWCNAQ